MSETGLEIVSDDKTAEHTKVRSFSKMDSDCKVFYIIALFFRGFNIAVYYYLMPFGIVIFTLIYAYRYSYKADLSYLQQ